MNPNGKPTEAEEDASCIGCNKPPQQGGWMLDCDDCHVWFHGACVGMPEVSLETLSSCFSLPFSHTLVLLPPILSPGC